VILIEEDTLKAEAVAGRLRSTRIINGSGSEKDILTECGVEKTDAFIATSDNDHSNLVSSMLAKKMGAKIAMITTQQPDYMSIVDAMDINVIINPHTLAVEQILHLVRGRGISSVTKLTECKSEAIELIPEEGAPITKAPIKKINFPKNAIIGAVYSESAVVLANGDTQIKAGQRVIVFCQEAAVKKIQALFTQRKFFDHS
jgi:trk system potassium uptake protein TrkA